MPRRARGCCRRAFQLLLISQIMTVTCVICAKGIRSKSDAAPWPRGSTDTRAHKACIRDKEREEAAEPAAAISEPPAHVYSTRAIAKQAAAQQPQAAREKRVRAAPPSEVESLAANAVGHHEGGSMVIGVYLRACNACAGAGLTLEERNKRIEALYLWAARLTGNIWTTPGTLPASVGGIPTSLLRGVLNNKEARDMLLSRLPEPQRKQFCERAVGSDVVELVFAVIHGKLGNHFDLPTLLGSLASTSFVAKLAGLPESERGFPMGPVSKSYACHSSQAGCLAWNDGTAMPGGCREGRHLAMHVKRALRKAGVTAQVAPVRAFHKNIGAV